MPIHISIIKVSNEKLLYAKSSFHLPVVGGLIVVERRVDEDVARAGIDAKLLLLVAADDLEVVVVHWSGGNSFPHSDAIISYRKQMMGGRID